MLLLVLGLRDHQAVRLVMILRTPHRRAQITFPLLAQSGHAPLRESAFAVAIGGKADMPFCAAHVRL